MKFLKWIVMISCNSGRFYGCVAPGRYLTGVVHEASLAVFKPLFGAADPVLYPRSSARFQAKELRRVGFNVRCVPYALILVADWLKARKSRLWKH